MSLVKQIIASVALALLTATCSQVKAQGNAQIVKQEPFEGQMAAGSILLVDDGTCGKGRIKQIIGGELAAMNPRPRARTCVPRGSDKRPK
jgi:hypothetical protein